MTYRKCVGCGEIKERSELIRIMKTYDTGKIIIMPTPKHFGRSSYVCRKAECLKTALRKKKLQKSLRKEIPKSTLEDLQSVLN